MPSAAAAPANRAPQLMWNGLRPDAGAVTTSGLIPLGW